VTTPTLLNNVRTYTKDPTQRFRQGADIDLAGYDAGDGLGWKAIGTTSAPFRSRYDGAGYKISNLTINRLPTSYEGLFGYALGADKFTNITLENVDIKGYEDTGGLIGELITSYDNPIPLISNVTVSGNVEIDSLYVGGIIGSSNGGVSMSNVHFNGKVMGNMTGGLVGYLSGTSQTQMAYFDSVFVSGDIANEFTIQSSGGLLGQVSQSVKLTINKCGFDGNVTGAAKAGGLIGSFVLTGSVINIQDCYATGSVSGTTHVGGLIGTVESGSSVTLTLNHSYAAASLTGGSTAKGGDIADSTNMNATITNTFYDQTVAGVSDTGKGVGLSTSLMKTQSSFTNYDFSSIWQINASVNNGYPYLVANAPALPSIPPTLSVPASISFGPILLTGKNSSVPGTISSFTVSDLSGTQAGWKVFVSASPLTHTGGQPITLPVGTLNMMKPTITPIGDNTAGNVVNTITDMTGIDSGSPIMVLSAASGNGVGNYRADYPVDGLFLTIPASIKMIDTSLAPGVLTSYSTTLTWTLNVGP
jgi:hypothetical protein